MRQTKKLVDVIVTRSFGDGIVDGQQVVRAVGEKMEGLEPKRYRLLARKVAIVGTPEARAATAQAKAAAAEAKKAPTKDDNPDDDNPEEK